MLGTAAYLSPEQARGEEAGPPSDIYSLGVCAYQFLAGRLPHEYASLTELALKQQQDPVAPITDYRPEVPRELDEAVRVASSPTRATATRPRSRWRGRSKPGCRGEETEVTRRARSLDAGDDTAATRAMSATRSVSPQPAVGTPGRSSPSRPTAARRGARRRPRASRQRDDASAMFLALLAALAAIAVVVIALASTGSSGGGVEAPDSNDIEQQIQQLRDLIQDNTG